MRTTRGRALRFVGAVGLSLAAVTAGEAADGLDYRE
jgi:hypothetical protein